MGEDFDPAAALRAWIEDLEAFGLGPLAVPRGAEGLASAPPPAAEEPAASAPGRRWRPPETRPAKSPAAPPPPAPSAPAPRAAAADPAKPPRPVAPRRPVTTSPWEPAAPPGEGERAAPPPRSRPSEAPARPKPTSAQAAEGLRAIAERVAACQLCGLHATRHRTVPGQGSPTAELVFVGEAPGADEDRQGLAFVGRAGELLTKMIGAMGLDREEVFIANVLKCRPPGNRDPRPDEVAPCLPYLREQLSLLPARAIVALGGHAMRSLLPDAGSVGRMRGKVHRYEGVPLIVTYHPAYLLRTPNAKRQAWEDLQLALRVLGRSLPPRGGGNGR